MSEDNTRYRPMQPGAQVGGVMRAARAYKKGTLSCFVESYAQPRQPGFEIPFLPGQEPKWEKFWITCAHVVSSGNASITGQPLYQPAVLIDALYLSHAGIGRCQAFGGKADAALVVLNDQPVRTFSTSVPAYTGGFNNKVLQWDVGLTKIGTAYAMDRVKMYGMESGRIEGAVADNVGWKQSGADLQGFVITTNSDLQEGDSGGPVFKDTGELVGMITAAEENNLKRLRCCHIQGVFDALSDALTTWYNSTYPGNLATETTGWKVGLRLAAT